MLYKKGVDTVRLDGNFYKKEVSERTTELSPRRNNIERYLLTRYGMNPQFATKVAGVLEKTSFRDNLLSSRMYDSVIEMAVQQISQSKSSSLSDARHIRESERDEHLYSQQTTGSQSQNNLPQQNATPLSEEEMRRKQQSLEQLQKLQVEAQQQREAMMARRSGRR